MKPSTTNRFNLTVFRQSLRRSLKAALDRLPKLIRKESLYAFALYTSGESDFSYLSVSANTEEALRRTATRYAREDPSYRGKLGLRRLRWSTPDWKYHDFDETVGSLALPPEEERPAALDAKLYGSFVDALRHLDREGVFGKGKARHRVTLNVVCGDISEDFFRHGLEAINPKAVVRDYLHDWTPDAFLRELNSLPARWRLATWIQLYEGLYLHRGSPLAERARLLDFTEYDAEVQIARLGSRAVPALTDIVERHAYASPFNRKGSPEWERDGACTVESDLASSAAFLIGRIGVIRGSEIRRLQGVIERRVELDRKLDVAPTVAENIARVLHETNRKRFPPSELHPRTNKLVNAESFLR